MTNFEVLLRADIQKALSSLYSIQSSPEEIVFQEPRKEFEGDFTLIVFPYAKKAGKSPEQVGQEMGEFLEMNSSIVSTTNVVKGFLNISLKEAEWLRYFTTLTQDPKQLADAARKQ